LEAHTETVGPASNRVADRRGPRTSAPSPVGQDRTPCSAAIAPATFSTPTSISTSASIPGSTALG